MLWKICQWVSRCASFSQNKLSFQEISSKYEFQEWVWPVQVWKLIFTANCSRVSRVSNVTILQHFSSWGSKNAIIREKKFIVFWILLFRFLKRVSKQVCGFSRSIQERNFGSFFLICVYRCDEIDVGKYISGKFRKYIIKGNLVFSRVLNHAHFAQLLNFFLWPMKWNIIVFFLKLSSLVMK